MWFKQYKISFFIQTFIGMSIIQVLISQYPAPITPVNWLTLFYIGVSSGIAGNSFGTSVGDSVIKNKKIKNIN